ncbi:DNA topoisomerase- type IA- core [Striga hermonthica]|uniref:DNA topoisomerase n=1 Tax=Striga hermonthica TaxID=68872 RepID=A0A9N7MUB2_STRHE|nr:DNA topoisomerase- type IA- core [Striga hermonthica]
MDLQIKHAVMGMTWFCGQVTQLQSRAFKRYPRICLKYASLNVQKLQNDLPRVGISFPLRIKNHPPRSLVDGPRSFSSFRFGPPLGCELPSTRMPMNISCYGLVSGLRPSHHFCTGTRSFSQIPRTGTRNNVVMTEGGAGGSTRKVEFFKKFKKHRKGQKALGARKGNAVSTEKLVSGTSEVKASAPENIADMPSSSRENVEGSLKSTISNSGRMPKGKEKVKHQSKSKKKQKQSSSVCASVDLADTPSSSVKNSQAKKIMNNKCKASSVSSENNLTSSSPTEEVTSNITTNNIPRMAKKKGQCNERKGSSAPKSKKETKGQSSDGKAVSIGKSAPPSNKNKPGRKKAWRQLYPPIGKSVVVVESVTKAKVIQGYLGDMYEVLPSYGHVRDLAARSGSVRPDDDFSMVWEVPSPAWSHLKSIKVALSGAENLILASDPDREGEAIAWHIIEMLHQQDALREGVQVARVVFTEITESSIKNALQAPREIDVDLVHAYLARRALDYLIGFNVSPLLWRKLPGCQSAGRVQSAALALLCEREKEIDEFKPNEYWTVDAQFQKKDQRQTNKISLSAHLTHFGSQKLSQLSIGSSEEAENIHKKVDQSEFVVLSTKTSKIQRNPPTPYITSTLQQDAANRLNFSASHTMKVAQKLYEGVQLSDGKATGLITYMRTDGLHLSDEAAKDIQSFVAEKYGADFAAKSRRRFFKKVKNAQEAHEAIRPTDIRRLPSTLVGALDVDALKLYTLIWARTMACQMEPAVIRQLQCDFANTNRSIIFRSTCSKVDFLGFQAVYKDAESVKIQNDEDDDKYHRSEVFDILSSLKSGDVLCLTKVELGKHQTQPPPRYTEGSLVKNLEELGIGRPSTYATTIKVLKDRNYITMKSRTLCPEFRGRMVSAFLSHYFSEVTDYSFTADMESELDNVSAGITEWRGLLSDYWTRFSKYCESASKVHIHEVEKMLGKTFGSFLFSSLPDGNRTCPSCLVGTLVFKVSRFGAGYFIGCDQHPRCKYIAKTLYGDDDEDATPENQKTNNVQEPKLLGLNPGTNEKVFLKTGPYGSYVQLGDNVKGHAPKRASASWIKDVRSITLEDALELLKYPLTLGNHPDDGYPVLLKLAKTGFSIKHRRSVAPVPKNTKPGEITMEKALELLQGKEVKRCGRPKRNKVKEAIEAM